ncbi:MAG TPA: hypothetical protein VFK78_09705 [Gemmatimonadales bacterium]|nr:hypothetical protein [Gemmatimonadales bacterium]
MATFLSSALAALALLQGAPAVQAPSPPPAVDSLADLRARVAKDSNDGAAWWALGRGYVRLSSGYHLRHPAADTARAAALLDSAETAFGRAAMLTAGTATGDSAAAYRVFAWGDKAFLAWELSGIEAAARAWGTLPEDFRLAPALQELGENLLRACPGQGVLLTADDADSYSAWYMRFTRGLRPDVLILPLALWRSDSMFRARVSAELKLPRAPSPDDVTWVRALAGRRPVCASTGFERPPLPAARLHWNTQPLVWVAGPEEKGDRVPPRDFVFAAARQALDEHQAWGDVVLAIYRRAATLTPALCEPLGTFQLNAAAGCRK